MVKNFFTFTFRNILRNRVYTSINILGLAMGITVAILIFLMVTFDLDFDKFHANSDRIYRVVHTSDNAGVLQYHANMPYPAGYDLAQAVHGVERFTQIHQDDFRMVEVDGQKMYEKGVIFGDSSFFEVFDFEVLSGNPSKSLKNIHTAFVAEEFATKHFGGAANAVGKEIRLANLMDLEIAGVVADPPASGHLQFQILVSYSSLEPDYVGGFDIDTWGASLSGYVYTLLPENVDKTSIEEQINVFVEEKNDESDAKQNYILQPVRDIHFNADYARDEFSPTVEASYLYMLMLIAFFILLIASINFINLSTALSIKRAKEVGIKKALGANRVHLIFQFLAETFLVVLVAVLLSMGLVERLLPLISTFLDKQLSFNLLEDPRIPLFLIGLLVSITVLAGLYPAAIISNFTPVKALRTKINQAGGKSISIRRGLVVFQFLISQALVIGSITIISQLNYFKSKPLGFEKEDIVLMDLPERDSAKMVTLVDRLQSNPFIESVSLGTGVPTSLNSIGTSIRRLEWDPSRFIRTRIKAVDARYKTTFGLELVTGEWLKEGRQAGEGVVLNQEAAKQLGFASPDEAVGQYVRLGVNGIEAPVVGIVKDFHTHSLHRGIGPLALFPMHDLYFEAGIKIDKNEAEAATSFILAQWEQLFPGYIYEYEYMDEMIAEMYSQEEKTLAMANLAAIFSIIIGCLGLYGLVSFMVIQKNKEVGIRKAIGASVGHIMVQFSKEFMILLTVSFVLAVPLVWYYMNLWLQEFAFHIELTPWFFIVGFLGSLAVAGITVGYKSWMAARINPVDALKDE